MDCSDDYVKCSLCEHYHKIISNWDWERNGNKWDTNSNSHQLFTDGKFIRFCKIVSYEWWRRMRGIGYVDIEIEKIEPGYFRGTVIFLTNRCERNILEGSTLIRLIDENGHKREIPNAYAHPQDYAGEWRRVGEIFRGHDNSDPIRFEMKRCGNLIIYPNLN